MLNKLYLIVALTFLGLTLNAQVLGEETQSADMTTFFNVNTIGAVVSQNDQFARNASISNGVFIQQIGEENIARIATSTNSNGLARIDLLQNGDNNYADIVDTSDEFYKNIVQNGDGNRVLDYSLPSDLSTNFQLLQSGDNLSLEKFGTNSLTEDIKVNMSGSARTVIIRSF